MKNVSFFIACLLLIAFSVIYLSCKKEYSYEGGPVSGNGNGAGTGSGGQVPQVASFTLEGSPNTCTDFKINGTYTSGVPLAADNTVEVMVDVLSIGSYYINTGTADGINFSHTGNFTKTGIQKVVLQGSGTPGDPANLTFAVNSVSSVCSFNLTVVTFGPPATYVLESNQDGTCTGYSVSGNFVAGTRLLNTNNIAVKTTVTVLGNYTIRTNTVNGMTFSYTGTFVTLGSQAVILTGSGTPAASGTYQFIPQIIGPHPIGGETCTADITVM